MVMKQQPKIHWEQKLSLHDHEVDVPVCSAGDVSPSDEGDVPVSSAVFAQAVLHPVETRCLPGCGPSQSQLL